MKYLHNPLPNKYIDYEIKKSFYTRKLFHIQINILVNSVKHLKRK